MSASRTLLRQHKLAGMYRNEEGEHVQRRRVKPSTAFRRQLWEVRDGDFLRSYHATKGHRCVRQPA